MNTTHLKQNKTKQKTFWKGTQTGSHYSFMMGELVWMFSKSFRLLLISSSSHWHADTTLICATTTCCTSFTSLPLYRFSTLDGYFCTLKNWLLAPQQPVCVCVCVCVCMCVCLIVFFSAHVARLVPTVLFLCMCLPACAYICGSIRHFQTGHKKYPRWPKYKKYKNM